MRSLPGHVWLFALIQSLAMSAGAMMVLVSGLLGAQLAPKENLATLPYAIMIIGTALGVLPVTRMMDKVGRKPIFISVAVLATSGALTAALATHQASFWLLLTAAFLLGVSVAGFQQIRFAVMESVNPDIAPKAASTVLLGGLVAAFLGPELVTLGQDLTSVAFTGSFLLMAVLGVISIVLFFLTKETHTITAHAEARPVHIKPVLGKPVFIVAVSSAVIGYALMSFIMTATPVHMHVMEHHSLEHTKWVIQSHIIAMFLPSFISGWLIARLGAYKVIVAGLAAYLLTIVLGLGGSTLMNYWLALILLGIGWNFLFLGGTVLLPQSHNGEQKMKVQGLNEFMIFAAQAVAALGAGVMLFGLGWQGLLLTSLAIIVAHILVLVWQRARMNKQLSPATAQSE